MFKVFLVIFFEGEVLALNLVISVYIRCYDLVGLSNFLIHLQLLKNRILVSYIIKYRYIVLLMFKAKYTLLHI